MKNRKNNFFSTDDELMSTPAELSEEQLYAVSGGQDALTAETGGSDELPDGGHLVRYLESVENNEQLTPGKAGGAGLT